MGYCDISDCTKCTYTYGIYIPTQTLALVWDTKNQGIDFVFDVGDADMIIAFKTTPKLGRVITVDAQRYVLIDTELYVRKDGAYSLLLTWQSYCPECGEAFSIKTGLRQRYINRRCDAHRRPGVAVKKSTRKITTTQRRRSRYV